MVHAVEREGARDVEKLADRYTVAGRGLASTVRAGDAAADVPGASSGLGMDDDEEDDDHAEHDEDDEYEYETDDGQASSYEYVTDTEESVDASGERPRDS